jgi:hypothetical protein
MADHAATQEPTSRHRTAGRQIDRALGLNVIWLKRRLKIAAKRQERRSVKNFSRNRPEATNLNHQYASRRVFMSSILDPEMVPHAVISAEAGVRV